MPVLTLLRIPYTEIKAVSKSFSAFWIKTIPVIICFHSFVITVSSLTNNKQNKNRSVTGFISLDEFAEACELLKKHLPEHDTKEQLLDICKLMDINKDGLVDLNEFLETFRLCEQSKSNFCGQAIANGINTSNDNLVRQSTDE